MCSARQALPSIHLLTLAMGCSAQPNAGKSDRRCSASRGIVPSLLNRVILASQHAGVSCQNCSGPPADNCPSSSALLSAVISVLRP